MNMKAFLLIGQSNMSGRGSMDDLQRISNENIFVLRQSGWETAEEPVVRDRPFSGQGLSLAFANCVHMLTGDEIGLIPASLGGSSLSEWMPGTPLFENAASEAKRAIRTGAELSGILWHQGEADSTDIKDAEAYEERLEKMLDALEARIDKAASGGKRIPVIMGELGGYLDGNSKSFYHDRVNKALHAVADRCGVYACVKAHDLPDKGDALHFHTLSLRRLGVRYASAWADVVFGIDTQTLPTETAEYV